MNRNYDSSGFEDREVTAEIWTKAMQAALNQNSKLHIPARDLPSRNSKASLTSQAQAADESCAIR